MDEAKRGQGLPRSAHKSASFFRGALDYGLIVWTRQSVDRQGCHAPLINLLLSLVVLYRHRNHKAY